MPADTDILSNNPLFDLHRNANKNNEADNLLDLHKDSNKNKQIDDFTRFDEGDELSKKMSNSTLSGFAKNELIAQNKRLDEEFWAKIKNRVDRVSQLEGWKINPNHQDLGGAMGSAARLNDLKDEGIVGEILGKIYIEFVKTACFYYYNAQWAGFKQAREEGLAYPGKDGTYPKIYKVNPETGKLDRNSFYEPGKEEIPREVIRLNGYFPPPDLYESIQIELASWLNSLYGQNMVPERLKKMLFEDLPEEAKKQENKMDAQAMGVGAAARAAPRPAV